MEVLLEGRILGFEFMSNRMCSIGHAEKEVRCRPCTGACYNSEDPPPLASLCTEKKYSVVNGIAKIENLCLAKDCSIDQLCDLGK